jgi:hypothetical protein
MFLERERTDNLPGAVAVYKEKKNLVQLTGFEGILVFLQKRSGKKRISLRPNNPHVEERLVGWCQLIPTYSKIAGIEPGAQITDQIKAICVITTRKVFFLKLRNLF